MRASGGRIFWASFFLTLAVIGPLLGLFAFWGVQQNRRAVQTQQAQSGGRAASRCCWRWPMSGPPLCWSVWTGPPPPSD